MNYTYEKWLKVNEILKLNNSDIANIIGTQENNVKVQLRPSKKLPTWIKTLMYGYYKGMEIQDLNDHYNKVRDDLNGRIEDVETEVIENLRLIDAFMKPLSLVDTKEKTIKYDCGCYVENGLFKRASRGKEACKLTKTQHK